ncbi:hypothetical protein NQ317_002512 [Molorchus minor]|uniref:Glucosylceramidase n=1 Tax=Molorchus minor TaxID=1323400 RepID=A0ABQ9J8A3_9CUCU|nr:hypothetical protein NQ317_002512 [Molorchus minor]
MIHDDSRLTLPHVVPLMLNDEDALEYIDGVAEHWYRDSEVPIEAFDLAKSDKKEIFLLSTESCMYGYSILDEKSRYPSLEQLQNKVVYSCGKRYDSIPLLPIVFEILTDKSTSKRIYPSLSKISFSAQSQYFPFHLVLGARKVKVAEKKIWGGAFDFSSPPLKALKFLYTIVNIFVMDAVDFLFFLSRTPDALAPFLSIALSGLIHYFESALQLLKTLLSLEVDVVLLENKWIALFQKKPSATLLSLKRTVSFNANNFLMNRTLFGRNDL